MTGSTPTASHREPGPDLGVETAADVLAFASDQRATVMRAEANLLLAACAWADMHPAPDEVRAATVSIPRFGDTGVTVAGPGAPRVAEFSVPELAARLGQRTEAGAALIGEALELRHRLPRLWARVQALEVEAWRARRIAQRTVLAELPPAGAAFVDRHLAPVAHSAGLPTVDRCLDEAIARFDPDRLEAEAGRDPRCFRVSRRQQSFDGHLSCDGVLGLDDGLAVDDAVRAEMARLRRHGATETDGPLSAAALVGLVCRDRQEALDLDADLDGAACPARPAKRRDRTILLHVHLSECAVLGTGEGLEVGRVEETRAPVTAEQIRAWCGADATTQIRVQPVLDLEGLAHVEQYEAPDRMRHQAQHTALTCTFPWCTRAAHACDLDHVVVFDHRDGGRTSTDNLAPLCRRHHRLKTHAPAAHRWVSTTLEPGRWLWRSPHGEHYLRDHLGTHVLPPEPPPRE